MVRGLGEICRNCFPTRWAIKKYDGQKKHDGQEKRVKKDQKRRTALPMTNDFSSFLNDLLWLSLYNIFQDSQAKTSLTLLLSDISFNAEMHL